MNLPGNSCTGCTACFAACSRRAITMEPDDLGFLRPRIDGTKCVKCGQCEAACPVLATPEPQPPLACFAAWTRNEELRRTSSSGGVFTEIARAVLAEGGCVFGCALSRPGLKAVHAKAEDEDGLLALRGSKYVQSDLRECFREARTELARGRKVLFSGTPCQIAGLRRFLKADPENLLTLDIICHGVPSPAVFERYRRETEQRAGSALTDVRFRDKSRGWQLYSLAHSFRDAALDYSEDSTRNLYLQVFLRSIALRESCYRCPFREGRSRADFTLSDFWGIEKVFPDLADDAGYSAVLVNSPRAASLWAAVSANVHLRETDLDAIARSNRSYRTCEAIPPQRKRFFRLLRNRTLERAYARSFVPSRFEKAVEAVTGWWRNR